jgi:hypothetical protein
MLTKDPQAEAVWALLEELYLEEATANAKTQYRGLSDEDKRAVLKAFAKDQSLRSKRWRHISGAMQAL